MVAGLVYIFSTKSTYVFINFIDYSRYFSKPWGCFVCICMCVIISNFYECFVNLVSMAERR